VSAFLASICGPSTLYLGTDMSDIAAESTLKTARANGAMVDVVCADLASAYSPRVRHLVDVLVFNPPYVETVDQEATEAQASGSIDRAWAGGAAGMSVTNRLLAQLDTLLSPVGRFYLVAVKENKPLDIIAELAKNGFAGEIVLKRRAGREHLHVLRFTRATSVEG